MKSRKYFSYFTFAVVFIIVNHLCTSVLASEEITMSKHSESTSIEISSSSNENDKGRILNSPQIIKDLKPVASGSRESKLPKLNQIEAETAEAEKSGSFFTRDEKIPTVHKVPEIDASNVSTLIDTQNENTQETQDASSTVEVETPVRVTMTTEKPESMISVPENNEKVVAEVVPKVIFVPITQDKTHFFSLSHFLQATEYNDNQQQPIILKPVTTVRGKSALAELIGRTCLHCQNLQGGHTLGRHGSSEVTQLARFEDFVPESNDPPIELSARELLRRRLNIQRISNLLPNHRSLPTLEQFLYNPNPEQPIKAPISSSEKTGRSSFWSTLFPFWPFSKKEKDPAESTAAPINLDGRSEVLKKPLLNDPTTMEDIILRPTLKPVTLATFPKLKNAGINNNKPLVIDNFILLPSSDLKANSLITMNEIHDELSKQNAVKLQPQSNSALKSSAPDQDNIFSDSPVPVPPPTTLIVENRMNTDLFGKNSRFSGNRIPANLLPQPRHKYPAIGQVEVQQATLPSSEEESFAQISPTTVAP